MRITAQGSDGRRKSPHAEGGNLEIQTRPVTGRIESRMDLIPALESIQKLGVRSCQFS
jgi:hypothetical protein